MIKRCKYSLQQSIIFMLLASILLGLCIKIYPYRAASRFWAEHIDAPRFTPDLPNVAEIGRMGKAGEIVTLWALKDRRKPVLEFGLLCSINNSPDNRSIIVELENLFKNDTTQVWSDAGSALLNYDKEQKYVSDIVVARLASGDGELILNTLKFINIYYTPLDSQGTRGNMPTAEIHEAVIKCLSSSNYDVRAWSISTLLLLHLSESPSTLQRMEELSKSVDEKESNAAKGFLKAYHSSF